MALIAFLANEHSAAVIAAILFSSTSLGRAEAIGKPSAETIAAAFTSGIAANNFISKSSSESGILGKRGRETC